MNGETPQDGKAQCAAFIPRWLQYVPAPPDRGKNKYDVFISYWSSDRGWALALYDALKLAGWEPFLDQFYLVAGQSLSVSLEEAMASSSSGVIIWSSNTKDSDWCRREREAMISLKDDTGKFSYVFAQLDKEPLPLFARSDVYVSFEQGTESPDGINLLKLICGLKGAPLPADAVRLAQQALETEQTILKQISGARNAGAVHRLRKLGTSEPLESPRPAFEATRSLMYMGAYNDALFVLENAEAHFPKSIDIRRLKWSVLR